MKIATNKWIWTFTGMLAGGAIALTLNATRTAQAGAVTPNSILSKSAPHTPYVAAPGRIEPVDEEIKTGSQMDGKLAKVFLGSPRVAS